MARRPEPDRRGARRSDGASRRTTTDGASRRTTTDGASRRTTTDGVRAARSSQTSRSRTRPATRPAARPRPASRRVETGRRYRRVWNITPGRSSVRIRAFMVAMALVLMVCVGRAFQLQAIDANAFAAEAAQKMTATKELPALRGALVDRHGTVLAATEPAMLISVDPDMVMTNGADKRYRMSERKQEEAKAAPAAVAEILARHLGGKQADYLKLVTTKDSRYEVVARQVPAATWTAIKNDMSKGFDGEGKRPWHGLFAEADPIRTYPNGSLASGVVGFVNGEGMGVAGLEAALEEELNGIPGQMVYDRSTYGQIPLGTNVMTPPEDGLTYQLTIDADLQWIAEQALAKGMSASGAKTGTLVAMDVQTGEVLALANAPSFDPAQPGKARNEDLGNRAVSSAYEPGSVQKVLTMAALADKGLVTPDTKVVVPPRIASGGGYVRDSYDHGTVKLTARGVMANSSNIGTIQLTRQMEKGTLVEYLSSFGLGSKPGSGLPAETAGSIPGADMADYTRDQISFGQGLSVGAVQMAAAVAAVTNGGVYHQPTVIKSATRPDGTPVDLPERATRRVVSEEASRMTVEMMEAVITMKDDRSIPGYRTAGKSGTAQRYEPRCKCYSGYTSSFVGVAPAENPQLLVYVVLDQPTNGNLGSQLALPVVNDVLRTALPRYNILPTGEEPPSGKLTFDE